MRFAPQLRALALLTSVALLPATTAGYAQVDSRISPEFAKSFGVYQRIKADYVEPVDDHTLIKGAIDGMLAALDPHSDYLEGAEFDQLKPTTDGNYGGLGHTDSLEAGGDKVIAPTEG